MKQEDIDEIDHLITAAKFDEDHVFIEKISTHDQMEGNKISYPYAEERDEVVGKLKDGSTYHTLVKGEERYFDYQLGERVQLIEVDGEEYIRIDDEDEEKDELGEVTKVRDVEEMVEEEREGVP